MHIFDTAKKRSVRRRNSLAWIGRALMLAVIVVIAMNNRKRILDKVRVFNKHYLNPCILQIAERRKSPYAILQHVGRRNGSMYTTPVVASFAQSWDGFVIPLPYGVNTDWCRNVMAAGRCTITKNQVVYKAIEPTIIDAAVAFPELPVLLRKTLRSIGVQKFLKVRIEKTTEHAKPAESAVAQETV